jgi:hypothetical protein
MNYVKMAFLLAVDVEAEEKKDIAYVDNFTGK